MPSDTKYLLVLDLVVVVNDALAQRVVGERLLQELFVLVLDVLRVGLSGQFTDHLGHSGASSAAPPGNLHAELRRLDAADNGPLRQVRAAC
ncbi:hypothetical protein ABT282_38865 [Streptomyces sp. NPDC000927]|uniref:hypothetical protein n=1 Tax=Streptomyces sp. NPDC000927 TaxID=3154371 RepID=UPI003324C572